MKGYYSDGESLAEIEASSDRLKAAIIDSLNADGDPISVADMIDCGVRYIGRQNEEIDELKLKIANLDK